MTHALFLAACLGICLAVPAPVQAEERDGDIAIAYDLRFFTPDDRSSSRDAVTAPRMGARRSIRAPATACGTGQSVAVFDVNQAAISTRVQTALEDTVSTYDRCGSAKLMLVGRSDSAGSSSRKRALALRRTAAVSAYLVIRGVPETAIAHPVLDIVGQQSRRPVEISYDPALGI